MPETLIKTRCLLSLTLRLFEDGNVEVESRKWDKKNALGRQNYLLTERERFALLSLIHDELEKYAIEDQRLDSHDEVVATRGGSTYESLILAQNEAMPPPGQSPNGGHVLGYQSSADEPGKLEIDEQGAEIVRRIFESYERHGSAGAVTRELSDLGIRYPKYETRSGKIRGGKLFSKQKIIGILRNPVYIGKIRWGDAEHQGNHPGLIDEEHFKRVQASLGEMVKRRINVKQPNARTYLLSGLLRCSCGAHLVGACAHGSKAKAYYYVCTRQTHEGGKYNCDAPRLPALALEQAVIDRIKELGQVLEDRERIVHEAISHLEGESERLQDGEQLIRKRLGTNKAEIGRLVEVLKSMGAKGLVSVQDELERLESEATDLKHQLKDLSQQQAPVEQITDQARSFVKNWEDIGELIDAATAEECRELLQHYIEVIELHSTDPKGRTGTYALRLFPEVRPDRDFAWNDNDPSEFLQQPALATKNGDGAQEDAIAVLTSDDVLFERSSGKLPSGEGSGTLKSGIRLLAAMSTRAVNSRMFW